MSNCGWCGKVITGEPVMSAGGSAIFMWGNANEVELMPDYLVNFCCNGCAWAFAAETHRLMGLSGKELRNHLINEHGFSYPPGKPAGGMRRDCIVVEMADSLVSVFNKFN